MATTVQQIMQMSVEELAEFLRGFYVSGNVSTATVDQNVVGLQNLTQIERFIYDKKIENAQWHIMKYPQDIEELVTRFYNSDSEIDREVFSETSSCDSWDGRQRVDEDYEARMIRKNNSRYARYNELLHEYGAQPFCTVQFFQDHLSHDADAHKELIAMWLRWDFVGSEFNYGPGAVYRERFDDWWRFRKWQFAHHGISEKASFKAFVHWFGAWAKLPPRHYKTASVAQFMESCTRLWESLSLNELATIKSWEDHVESTKATHRYHVFNKPLVFDKEHPLDQDQWTTWIEYLQYQEHLHQQLRNKAFESLSRFIQTDWEDITRKEKHMSALVHGWYEDPKESELPSRESLLDVVSDTIRQFQPCVDMEKRASMYKIRTLWILQKAREMDSSMSDELPVSQVLSEMSVTDTSGP